MESLKRPASCLQNDGAMEATFRRPSVQEIHMAVLKELRKISDYNTMQVLDPKYNALLRLWIALANNAKTTDYLSEAFFILYRTSALAILSPDWKSVSSVLKENFNGAILMTGKALASIIEDCSNMCLGLSSIANDPWGSHVWQSILNGKLDIDDVQVQHCLGSESEELTLTRVQLLTQSGCERQALLLAKCVFKFYFRVLKNSGNHSSHNGLNKRPFTGAADYSSLSAMEWLLILLQKKEKLSDIIKETMTLSCHEGVQLIRCIKTQIEAHVLIEVLINIFLVQDFMRPSKYCCTKELITLWCSYQEQQQIELMDIADAARKLLVSYASTSAHFYLFVDVLWEQFGSSLLSLYVDMYVRGLTADINFLEVARSNEMKDTVHELETHIAGVLSKLSTLFSDGNEEVSRECMLSAFSLRPTKERLYILQSLTHSILSKRHHAHNTGGNSIPYSRPVDKCSKSGCACGNRCSNVSHITVFSHPLLLKGIKGIPYSIVKDLVSLLEGVRCNTFQFNSFDWHKAASDLGDYLKAYNKHKNGTNFLICDNHMEIDTVPESAPVDCGVTNHFKDGPIFMPEGLHARSIPFQHLSPTVPLKEVKTPLSTSEVTEPSRLAADDLNISSGISSVSFKTAVSISQSSNASHRSISAPAITKSSAEERYYSNYVDPRQENSRQMPESISIAKPIPMHGEKPVPLVNSRKPYSKPIILRQSASGMKKNSVDINSSISSSENAVINPQITGPNALNYCRDYPTTYSHLTSGPQALKIERNIPVMEHKLPIASNIPDGPLSNRLLQPVDLPINYSNYQSREAESTREPLISRNLSPSFVNNQNDPQSIGHTKFSNKTGLSSALQNETSHKTSVIVHSDSLDSSRSHVNVNVKSEGSAVKSTKILSTLEQSIAQGVLSMNPPSNQQVYTQLPRIPVSVNQITRMTLQQFSSTQEKAFSVPAFKISVPSDIKKLSGNKFLSANLVIPRNQNHIPGTSGNSAALPSGSNLDAISIPGLIVFKSSRDKGLSPALKFKRPIDGSSENIEQPQKRIWTSYRSTFGEVGFKKTGQRSFSMSSPVNNKVQLRPTGNLPSMLCTKNTEPPVISNSCPTLNGSPWLSLNTTNDSSALCEYSNMQPSSSSSRTVSSPMPSVFKTGSLSSAMASSEPSSFETSKTPYVISVHGKLALNDSQRSKTLCSPKLYPAFTPSVVHNSSPGSNTFTNVALKVTSPNTMNQGQSEPNVNFCGLQVKQSSYVIGGSTNHEQGLPKSSLQFQNTQKVCCSSTEVVPCQSCSQSGMNTYGNSMQSSETNFMPLQGHSTYTAGSSSTDAEDSAHAQHIRSKSTDSNKKKRCFGLKKNCFIRGKSSCFGRKTFTHSYKTRCPRLKVLVSKENRNESPFMYGHPQLKNCVVELSRLVSCEEVAKASYTRVSTSKCSSKSHSSYIPDMIQTKYKPIKSNFTNSISAGAIEHCTFSAIAAFNKLGYVFKESRVVLNRINVNETVYSKSLSTGCQNLVTGQLARFLDDFSRSTVMSKAPHCTSSLAKTPLKLKHSFREPVVLLHRLSIKPSEMTVISASKFTEVIGKSNRVVVQNCSSTAVSSREIVQSKSSAINHSKVCEHRCKELIVFLPKLSVKANKCSVANGFNQSEGYSNIAEMFNPNALNSEGAFEDKQNVDFNALSSKHGNEKQCHTLQITKDRIKQLKGNAMPNKRKFR